MKMKIEVEKEKKDKEYGKYEKYEIEDAARTLREAERIKNDKEKMKYVTKCLEKDAKAFNNVIKSIKDIRVAANEIEDEDED